MLAISIFLHSFFEGDKINNETIVNNQSMYLKKPQQVGVCTSVPISVLVRRAQAGDKRALSQLMDLTEMKLYARVEYYAQSFPMLSEDDVMDAFDDGFQTALKKFDASRQTSFIAYTFTIVKRNIYKASQATSKCVFVNLDDYLGEDKKVTYADQLADDDYDETPCGEVVYMNDESEMEEWIDKMNIYLSQFPEKTQRIIWLRYQYGATWQEIGDIFGCTGSNAEGIAKRALKQLRVCLEKALAA